MNCLALKRFTFACLIFFINKKFQKLIIVVIFIITISVGLKTNINNSANKKYKKYQSFRSELSSKFENVSVSSLSIFGNICDTSIYKRNDLHFDKKHFKIILMTLMHS